MKEEIDDMWKRMHTDERYAGTMKDNRSRGNPQRRKRTNVSKTLKREKRGILVRGIAP